MSLFQNSGTKIHIQQWQQLVTFRRVAGTKLPNKYICFEDYIRETDQFPRKTLNSAARLISMAKQQVARLGSKFHGPQKTVMPNNDDGNKLMTMIPLMMMPLMMTYLWEGLSSCSVHVPMKSRSGTLSDQHSVLHRCQCCCTNDVNMATIAKAPNDVVCWSAWNVSKFTTRN